MDDGSWRYIIAYILLIFGGAYFASSESAYAAMNKIRVRNLADDGDRRAKRAMYISNNFDKAITTILIGNNIMHIACASLATVFTKRLWGSGAVVYSTIITTVIVFLMSEMIPKSYAKANSEKLALAFSGSLKALMKILTPVAFFFMSIGRFFSRIFAGKEAPSITEDELETIIDTVEEEGVLDEDRSDLLQSAMEFTKTAVADVLTARDDIVAVSIDISSGELLDKIKQVKFSRLPVYSSTIDNIIGILPIRKFLKAYIKRSPLDIRSMLAPPLFVTPAYPINRLLREMSRSKIYMAIVTDINKKTLGLVTVEDFLEELVGEIWDEDDVINEDFIKLGGNRFEVSGTLPVREAFRQIGYECDDPATDSKAVQTWVLESFGRVPEEDESFTYRRLLVSVSDMNGNRIKKVIIRLMDEKAPNEAADDSPARAV